MAHLSACPHKEVDIMIMQRASGRVGALWGAELSILSPAL